MATIAVTAGALIGLVAPFFPMLAGVSGASVALAAIPKSMAIFAATGLSMGMAGGLMLGRAAGSAAGVAEESERRRKEWTIRQILAIDPQAEIPHERPKETPPKRPFRQRMKEVYKKYLNPGVGLAMAAIGAVGGLLFAAAYVSTGGAGVFAIMPALETLTGLTAAQVAAPGVIAAYSAGVGAAFGGLFAFNIPQIAENLTSFFGDLLTGKIVGRAWGPSVEQLRAQEKIRSEQPEQASELVEKPCHAAKMKRSAPSYIELVSQPAAPGEVAVGSR